MSDDDRLPPTMAKLHRVELDTDDGESIDFEPYQEFYPKDETTAWIRAWTNNPTLEGDAFKIFGQDGSGGYAAFWMVRPGKPVTEQPVVFFGSEGELGVVAADFNDYLWLLAGGVGPYEAVAYPDDETDPHEELTAFAEKHAPAARKTPQEVLARAKKEFPDFEKKMRALIKK
jgi:hypothetical protein